MQADKSWTEEKLLAGLSVSDNAALIYFYKRYTPRIQKMVLANTGLKEDAEDIFQECLIDLVEILYSKKLTLTCTVKTYFYSMCWNKWLSQLRKRSKTVSLDYTHEEEIIEISNSYEEREELNDRQRILLDILNLLGEPCHKILILFFYENRSMADIAVEMGYTNADNAKNQKYKCLQRLTKIAKDNNLKDFLG